MRRVKTLRDRSGCCGVKECNFEYQEFLLTPSTVGVPNSRLRYYCIARRSTSTWNFKRKDEIMHNLPQVYGIPYFLEKIIEPNVGDFFLIPDKLLKKGNLLDICYRDSKRSCCFTKAYSHYVEGTGSVFTEASPEYVEKCYKKANSFEVGSIEFVETLKQLKMRWFTPKEVASLMSFPSYYEFPESISMKQCYRLLGNSVNVKVIAELLRMLFD